MTRRSKPPSRWASAQLSSTSSCASNSRRSLPPWNTLAADSAIGPYRALSNTAAKTAAATVPPAPSTETSANWAEPAKVVSDMTIEAVAPNPAAWASTPKDAPKANTAGRSGATARRPACNRGRWAGVLSVEGDSGTEASTLPAVWRNNALIEDKTNGWGTRRIGFGRPCAIGRASEGCPANQQGTRDKGRGGPLHVPRACARAAGPRGHHGVSRRDRAGCHRPADGGDPVHPAARGGTRGNRAASRGSGDAAGNRAGDGPHGNHRLHRPRGGARHDSDARSRL